VNSASVIEERRDTAWWKNISFTKREMIKLIRKKTNVIHSKIYWLLHRDIIDTSVEIPKARDKEMGDKIHWTIHGRKVMKIPMIILFV
jgi:hypothetical protein